MRPAVYIGVDLGTSVRRKSTGLAYLVEQDGKPLIEDPPLHIISDDELIRSTIIGISENFKSSTIGIDAPLSRPDHGSMRECEKRLRKHGIACFPSGALWVSAWVDKGIRLRLWAEKELGAKVLEVYPYAARRALNLGVDLKKKSKAGRRAIQDGLLMLIAGLDRITEDRLLSDDELDAILSAYTACLEANGDAVEINGADGVIYLPMKMRDHRINEF